VDVVLYTAGADGAAGISGEISDADGRFVFEGIATEAERIYLVGARSGEIPLGERVSFAPGTREAEVVLRLSEPSADTSAATVGSTFLRIDRGCELLRVTEAHAVSNPTSQVIYVPEDQRQGATPVLEAELPSQAANFRTPFGNSSLGFEVDGSRVRFWGPVYPGDQELEFGYSLPGSVGSHAFERGFPSGSNQLLILSDSQGPRVRAENLAPAEGREVEGRPYRALGVDSVAAGARIAFVVDVPLREAGDVVIERSEIWLELDDAALTVDESHLLQVESAGVLSASSDAPLLCLPLPPGAEALRFSSETLGMGIEVDATGALAFRGPLPAGSSVVSLRYRLPVRDPAGSIRLVRHFPSELALLSIYVADNGVLPETARLHRKRTVQRSQRNYLHLEGFQIEPGEEVVLDLERLGAPKPLARLASTGFALLFAAAALAFMMAPVGGRRRARDGHESRTSQLAAEREAVYASIRDLEEDFETGKLTSEDHDTLRAELRTRAVRLLQAERAAGQKEGGAGSKPSGEASAASQSVCRACGESLPDQARFCAQCGEKVAGAGA
jgi:cytochrome c-type biogenesis protein CcmI